MKIALKLGSFFGYYPGVKCPKLNLGMIIPITSKFSKWFTNASGCSKFINFNSISQVKLAKASAHLLSSL